MSSPGSDNVFAASIASLYERHLVPLIFAPYAIDIAAHVARHSPNRVLEIAAGTGVVTRELARTLPAQAAIIATDLNQPMLDQAASSGTSRPVQWQQADAMQLPFPDQTFDVVVCQFGVMFFPDKAHAFAEARRVLRPGGVFLFNAWDAIDQNEFAATVTQALAAVFADDPPQFLARVPHGYHDTSIIARDLAAGGFAQTPTIDIFAARSRAESPDVPAFAYCQGTPLRNEIEQRSATSLLDATAAATSAIARRFGVGNVDGKIQAHIVAVKR